VGDVDEAVLIALCREHLAPYKIPVAFHRLPALPRNEVGKLLRRQLMEEFLPLTANEMRD
jgi:acyl-CoA synthetase (AMP-forming)/AMP-acid ligase II